MVVTRRSMLLLSLSAAGCAPRAMNTASVQRGTRRIQTVTGGVPAERLGLTLMHEHVLVDFIGADKVSARRYNADEAFKAVLPHLRQARGLGCETLAECTPAYLGRDPVLLRRLSEASGLHILTNT